MEVANGTPISTKQLVGDVKKMIEMVGFDEVKRLYEIDDNLLGKILTKKFSRRNGTIISKKDITNAKKTIGAVKKISKSLGLNQRRSAPRRSSSSDGINVIQIKN